MNSYGSSFKYFNNFSHKFGDAATEKKKLSGTGTTNHGY
jgi:hypothetical protein